MSPRKRAPAKTLTYFAPDPHALFTFARIERPTDEARDYVTLWSRGEKVGRLTLRKGDGVRTARQLGLHPHDGTGSEQS